MPLTRAELVQQIENARFTPMRMLQGYDITQVDDFLEALGTAVAAGMPVADLVGRARFAPVGLREGYATAEVDEFLRQLVDQVHELDERAPYDPDEVPSGPATRSPLAQRCTGARFSPVRLREGYDMGEVDRLLDEIGMAADVGGDVRTLAGEARITRVRLREGYDISEVDAFLREVVAEAEGGRPEAPAPASLPTVVEEQRGWLARLLGGR